MSIDVQLIICKTYINEHVYFINLILSTILCWTYNNCKGVCHFGNPKLPVTDNRSDAHVKHNIQIEIYIQIYSDNLFEYSNINFGNCRKS